MSVGSLPVTTGDTLVVRELPHPSSPTPLQPPLSDGVQVSVHKCEHVSVYANYKTLKPNPHVHAYVNVSVIVCQGTFLMCLRMHVSSSPSKRCPFAPPDCTLVYHGLWHIMCLQAAASTLSGAALSDHRQEQHRISMEDKELAAAIAASLQDHSSTCEAAATNAPAAGPTVAQPLQPPRAAVPPPGRPGRSAVSLGASPTSAPIRGTGTARAGYL